MNNTVFFNNIDVLRNKYDKDYKDKLKIGDFEKAIEVSPGYFSRLEKNADAIPNLDVIMKISQFFNVSIDFLLMTDLNVLTEAEKLVIDFVNKVRDDTIQGKFQWKDDNIVLRVADYKIPESKDEYGYNAHMNGFAQMTQFDENHTLKVEPLVLRHKGQELSFIKLTMVDDETNGKTVIADGAKSKTEIHKALNELYACILDCDSQMYMSRETRQLINDYLNN